MFYRKLRRSALAIILSAGCVAAVPLLAQESLIAPPVAMPAAGERLDEHFPIDATDTLTVAAVEPLAGGVSLVLEEERRGSRTAVLLAASPRQIRALGTGDRLSVSSTPAGWLLSSRGTVRVFLPNETGRRLSFDPARL